MNKVFKALVAVTLMTMAMLTVGCGNNNSNNQDTDHLEAVGTIMEEVAMEAVEAKDMKGEEVELRQDNSYDYVDLGLPSGTLWAVCNVGATLPEEYGSYFTWGETEPKEVYDEKTYKYNDDENYLTKYNLQSYEGHNGFVDNLSILLPEDDAATANWGAEWRTPTKEEWEELIENTTHAWTDQNEVGGRLFTGPNGNSIFLPAGGYQRCNDEGEYEGLNWCFVNGCYWTSSIYRLSSSAAWNLSFGSSGCHVTNSYRVQGYAVRAVYSAK